MKLKKLIGGSRTVDGLRKLTILFIKLNDIVLPNKFENDEIKKCYFFIAKINNNATPMPFSANERLEATEGPPRGIVINHPENFTAVQYILFNLYFILIGKRLGRF